MGKIEFRAAFAAARICISLFLVLILAFAADVHAEEYSVASAPAWVRPIAPDPSPKVPLDQISDGTYVLLSDSQTRINGAEKIAYRHYAMNAVTAKGVESIANISIPFDPAFQKLALHSINVIRDGKAISKLQGAQVRVVQREAALEYRIYDGRKTANVFLDDVRVGDTIDYSYSVSGSNPVFGGLLIGAFALQFDVPIARVHARLLVPVGRAVQIVPKNTSLASSVREHDGYRDYVWDDTDVAPTFVERDAPLWYRPSATVLWSEFRDWASVARWAVPLYQAPRRLGPSLQAAVEHIRSSASEPSDRMLAALHFVQREVRYLGVEIGPGSHAPNPPDLVFERRFGDCKDKALLTVAMLHALGIEARPALVNTELQRGVADWPAGPDSFNHVIVRARIGKEQFWLDPTRPEQKGDLDHLFQPDFGVALVVDKETRALESMKRDVVVPRRMVHSLIDASDGFEKPLHLTITSTYAGEQAERVRDQFSARSREDSEKRYHSFYARYYPTLTRTAPIEIDDDATTNRLVTTEHYDIPGLSNWSETSHSNAAVIQFPDIDSVLQEPMSQGRHGPLTLEFPFDFTAITQVRLPGPWKIDTESTKVDDPAFTFERNIAADERSVTLTDCIRTSADHVLAADVARYAGNIIKAREHTTGYRFTWRSKSNTAERASGLERFNWLLALLGTMMLLLWLWIARTIYLRDPPLRTTSIDYSLRGISGWLLLPAVGIVITPFWIAKDLYASVSVLSADTWSAMTTYGSERYDALWAPVILFEMFTNLGMLVLSTLLVIVFFQRRRGAPRLYIATVLGYAGAILVDCWLASMLQSVDTKVLHIQQAEALQIAVRRMPWVIYFLVSRRVQSTFTREYGQRSDPSKAAAEGYSVNEMADAFPARPAEEPT